MVGNKDDRANLRETFSQHAYLQECGEFIAYAIEDLPVRIIVVDTLNPGSNKGEFCEDRLAGLTAMFAQDTARPVAVFAHHPPFLVQEGPDALHFESQETMLRFRQALRACATLTAVFCGHVHRGVAGTVGPVPVLVMPCIATSLRRGEYPKALTTSPIYHLHRFEPDGVFTSELRIVGRA